MLSFAGFDAFFVCRFDASSFTPDYAIGFVFFSSRATVILPRWPMRFS